MCCIYVGTLRLMDALLQQLARVSQAVHESLLALHQALHHVQFALQPAHLHGRALALLFRLLALLFGRPQLPSQGVAQPRQVESLLVQPRRFLLLLL